MKKLIYLLMAVLVLLAAASCKKNPKVKDPSVKTLEATVEVYRAVLHGQIDFDPDAFWPSDYGFVWGTSEDSKGTYVQGLSEDNIAIFAEVRDLAPETDYWCKAVATFDGRSFTGEILKFTTEKNPVPDGAVDLGIVMTREDGTTYKLYWATCNLCKDGFVSSPEVYGDYYAWGETEPKENYSWSTYKFGTGSSGTFSKYDTDNKTVLETGPDGDDAASKKLGGRWRMPTDKEWAALRAKCVWEWTDNYNGTGVKGRILTSRISGYTDMSIFLPAAGGRYESGISDIGIWGIYWSSSLYTDRPSQAWYAYFHDGNIGSNYNGSGYSFRSDGYSVRPVCVE